MNLDVLFWLVMLGIVLVAMSRSVSEPQRTLDGIFRYRGLLWPAGVQEDDDTHWSWARIRREKPAAPARAAAAVEAHPDPLDERATPEVQDSRYEVRSRVRYRVRSADRDRS